MSLSVSIGNTWKSLAKLSVGVGGVYKTVSEGWVGVGGAWKNFLAALGVTIDATAISGAGPNPVTTGTCTATATGGVPGYTYEWLNYDGDIDIGVDSPNSATTTWTRNGSDGNYIARWYCRVTDAASNTIDSVLVTVTTTIET